jgi:hypothetical protein
MGIIEKIKGLFVSEVPECDHLFKGEDVTNLNIEPHCIHCKKSATVIMAKHGVLMRFHWINDSECKFLEVAPKQDQP